MKKYIVTLITLIAILPAHAQQLQVVNKDGYQLTFINQDKNLDPSVQHKMIWTFFKVYPELAKTYNPQTLKKVTMVVDTAYKGVAETDNGKVTISAAWMHKRPEDLDVITHEVMHIVQDYGQSVGPGWLTEGIADYARYKFGVNNDEAGWSLTPYKPGQSYENSYRITARFLLWLEANIKPGIVKTLNTQLRLHTYTSECWRQLTGKTLDELWGQYVKDPTI